MTEREPDDLGNLTWRGVAVAQSFDFYRPPIIPDPSLRSLERRGVWAFGGSAVLAAILVLACLLRLDKLGHEPLGPAEACITRDWQKNARALDDLERREILAPIYRRPLQLWGDLGSSPWMLRFYSTLWALALVALIFRLGATYLSPATGALAALLAAVSPPLVAASQDIGPATEAAVLLLLNFACLLRTTFRRANEWHWAAYALTGALAVGCHPLSVWVIVVQAVLAFVTGPREVRQPFYGRLVAHTALIALFAWVWFRSTRPLYPFSPVDWGAPTEWGILALARLLGATAVWGTRVYPAGWPWTVANILLVVMPLVLAALSLRQRQTQELAGFLVMSAVVPPALILLAPGGLTQPHGPATEVLALTFAPLSLWAATVLRLGMRERGRRLLTGVLVLGGALVTLWSSRVEAHPDWTRYRLLLTNPSHAHRTIVTSRVARLADFERYLASQVKMESLDNALALPPPADKSLIVVEARSPLYRSNDPADSPAPLIRTWLEKNCARDELLRDEFFRITLCTNADLAAMRQTVNRDTFYNPAASETMPFVRWFGPFDSGFTRFGATSRLAGSPATSDFRRVLVAPHAQWAFEPHVPPGYYHVFVPLGASKAHADDERLVVWTLPDGAKKPQRLTPETDNFSFIWEAKSNNEPLRMVVFEPLTAGREGPTAKDDGSGLSIYGVGLRQHFPYDVDVGAPFDDLALGSGWHEPQREGDVTYRWTDARAQVSFYLPEAGGMIALEGRLRLRVAQRQPEAPARLKFEVVWDGRDLKGNIAATQEWDTVLLTLPEAPAPGRHELLIKAPVFRAPDPANPNGVQRLGILVDRISVE